jgi:hypothetical protein
MATIGTDCHLTLKHDDINSGNEYGFLLDPASNWPEGIVIKREVYTEDDEPMKVWVYFDVLLADEMINPDGSQHTETRTEMYEKLVEYLGKQDSLQLAFSLGLVTELGAIGYASAEKHYADYSAVRVQLTNVGEYFGVIDEDDYNNSVWDGTLTWETSYWR